MFKVKKLKEFKKHFQPEPKRREVIYTARYAEFISEEDNYENGILYNNTGTSWRENLDLHGDSLDELFKKVKKALYMEDKEYFWWADSNDNYSSFRVEFLGDINNYLASQSLIELWKQGKARLWNVQGFIDIQKTTEPTPVQNKELERFAKRNSLNFG